MAEKQISYYITDKDDIYVFFEVIKLAHPKNVLDVGMFLKRIGAVSRNVKDAEIPEDIVLDAYVSEKDPGLNIYNTIYNDIYVKEIPAAKYELAMIIRPDGVFSKKDTENMIRTVAAHAKNILVDVETLKNYKTFFSCKKTLELSSGGNGYRLLFI